MADTKITTTTDRKSPVNTRRFATAPLTSDTAEELVYGDVTEVTSTLITAKYTPKMNSAEQYASGIAVDGYVSKAGGTLDLNVVGLNADDEHNYFGSTIRADGVIESKSTDVVPDLMVIYSTERSDGTLNLYKFLKTKFTSQGETAETTDASGIKYTGTAMKGDYKNTLNNNKDMVLVKGIDPKTNAEFIDNWFKSAMFGVNDINAPATASVVKA